MDFCVLIIFILFQMNMGFSIPTSISVGKIKIQKLQYRTCFYDTQFICEWLSTIQKNFLRRAPFVLEGCPS